jgi:hypothetical protein
MAVVDSRVRKGSLTIGGEVFSCQPTNVNIAPDHSGTTEDPVEVLCGDTIVDSGGQTLTAELSITAIQDFTDAAGFVGYSWSNDGTEQDFTWQPTDQAADAWSGKLTVQAVIIGGDVSARLTSEATWPITELIMPTKLGGKTVIGGTGNVAVTGVTAGTPGSFQPSGATLPADLTTLKADPVVGDTGTSKPTTAWTTAQYVTLGNGSHSYWDGTAWLVGEAP